MSPLALMLAVVLICAAALIMIPTIQSGGFDRLARSYFIGYALIVCATLAIAIGYFVGFTEHTNPRLPLAEQRRFAHVGYYAAPNSSFVFVGKAKQQGFVHEALGEDESITLEPIWTNGRADNWRIKYDATSRPLRLGGRCVNLPDEWWLNSGDVLRVVDKRRGVERFFAIRWKSDKTWRGVANTYAYSQGVRRAGQLIFDVNGHGQEMRDLLFSTQVLREGRRTSFMFAHPLATFAGPQPKDAAWLDLFEGIMWVREQLGDNQSRMGVLISQSLFAENGLEFYKNDTRLGPAQGTGEEVFPATSTVFYGLGFDNALNLQLQNQPTFNPARVEVHFVDPQTWRLPNADAQTPDAGPANVFIITSGKDYIPLNSFYINLGGAEHAFYAKAKLSDALDSITINDGKGEAAYPLRQVFRLGDLQSGALLALVPIEPSISHAGWWAITFLIIAALLFVLDALKVSPARWRLELAWTLIWGMMLTILVVRFILAYRLSLLPPDDATPNELANVFHRALGVSFKALFTLPSALIGVRFLARSAAVEDFLNRLRAGMTKARLRKRARHTGGGAWRAQTKKAVQQASPRESLLVLCALLPIGWAALGKAFGQTEALFGGSLRVNLLTHVILVALIALTAETLVERDNLGYRLGATISILFTLAILIFWIGDKGFLIYGIAFGLYLSALFLWHRRRTYFRYIIPVLVVVILAIPPLLGFIWSQRLQGTYLGDTTNFRIASYTETEDAVLLARSDEADASVDRFLSNIQQHWQMLLYAARGVKEPRGFGKSPLTHKAMTYPTSMADCVFSVYVLSEHGMVAGGLLLLVYIMLCFAVIYGSWFLPGIREHRVLPLITIGAFFACNALYMASANISLLPFTGQNIPLLSLYSTSDLLQNGLLIAIAVWLLTNGLPSNAVTILKARPAVRELGKAFLVLIILWGGVFIAAMRSMAASPRYEKYNRDFDLRRDVLEEIKRNVDPQQNNKWALVQEVMTPQNYATVSEIEQYYAKQFNDREGGRKYDRDRGLYYLQRLSNAPPVLRVNDRYFRMESPFKPREGLWRGLILARDDQVESLVGVLGKPLRLNLKDAGQTQTVSINETDPAIARSTLIEGCNRHLIQIELKRRAGKLLLGHKDGDWDVYVNGNKIEEDYELKDYDIIVVERSNVCRYNMMYLGRQPAALAYVKWQNGAEQRIISEDSIASLAYALGRAADQAKENGQALPNRLTLTLDTSLQRTLQQAVEDYAKQDPHFRENDPFNTDALAVSVLDAFSGAMLALPSWPLVDPSEPKYARANLPPARKANLLTNHNLTNHAVGSTVKPLIFATLASQFWPDDLSALSVYNRAQLVVGDQHLHRNIAGIPINEWNCGSDRSLIDAKEFLYYSLNYYEATIGTLGLLFDKHDLFGKVLEKSPTAADVIYKGQNYALDVKRAELALSTPQSGSRPSTDMDKTLLFKGLSHLFRVQITNKQVTLSDEACALSLPTLCGSPSAFQSNDYIDNALPQPIVFAPNSFQYFDTNTLRFFIGADQCQWNNVSMAEAAARLVTGQRVVARLEQRSGNVTAASDEMPAPINDSRWRYEHLIDPLERAGQIGTARFIGVQPPPGFKILYKTGTINEGNKGRESENLLFVIGKWDSEQNHFIPGQTLACFLYMKESKQDSKTDEMKKFVFAQPIIKRLLAYIQQTEAAH